MHSMIRLFVTSQNADIPLEIVYLFFIFLLFGMLGACPAIAQTDVAEDDLIDGFDHADKEFEAPAGEDDLFGGFEDDGPAGKGASNDDKQHLEKEDPTHIGGHVKTAASYNFSHKAPKPADTDWRGLSRLKAELLLELDLNPVDAWRIHMGLGGDYDLVYALKGRENYTDPIMDAYESDLQLKEAYLQGPITRNLDLKAGRQIVVWGRSDNIRVVDIINPLDLREPGITDIENLRLPVTMTKLDYYRGPYKLSGMLIHEVRFARNPPFGSDFYPSNIPPPLEDIPPDTPANSQYALSFDGIFSGWDLSFYWADLYSTDTHLLIPDPDFPTAAEQKHARINMIGSAGNLAVGNWLVKGEAAWLNGLKFTNNPDKIYNRLDLLIGVEYSGITDMQICLELADQHLFQHDDNLREEPDGRDRDQFQWAARLNRNFMHETLALTLLISVHGERWQNGALQRISAEYDLTDALMLSTGVVFYQSGNLPGFKNVENNDRFFLEFKYSF